MLLTHCCKPLSLALTLLFATPTLGAYQPPRTADGKPDLSGVWQVLNTANDSLEAHPGRAAQVLREGPAGPVPVKELVALGAVGAIPASIGVVEGDSIPYREDARAQREEHQANWITTSPAGPVRPICPCHSKLLKIRMHCCLTTLSLALHATWHLATRDRRLSIPGWASPGHTGTAIPS